MYMKNSLITNFFGQPSLFTSFDDAFNNVIDCSVDSYKYRTILNQDENCYSLVLQAPGLTKEDIKMSVDQSILKISGEKEVCEGMFCSIDKEFSIGKDVDESKISAKVENGILYITLPKVKSKKVKTIKIN